MVFMKSSKKGNEMLFERYGNNFFVMKAFEFMVEVHAGQTYGNVQYFTHPLSVAEQVMQIPFHRKRVNDITVKAALLHDVVEDTQYDIDYIRKEFGHYTAIAVELLTKDENLSYQENINRIIDSGNFDAMAVKWADNYVNMSGDKSDMKPERREKLNERYAISFRELTNALMRLK